LLELFQNVIGVRFFETQCIYRCYALLTTINEIDAR